MTAPLQQLLAKYSRALLAAAPLLICAPLPTRSEQPASEGATAASSDTMTKEDAENTGTDLTQPVNSFEVRFRYRPSSAPGSETEKEYAILRATTRIDLDQGWKVSLFAQTEGENKQTSKSSGSTENAGLGDSTFQAILIREFDERWAAGAGVRVIAPTAEDDLGSEKLQVMPGFGVRYSFLELGPDTFFAPQMRYAVSVAGTNSTRDISELQMAPLFNLDLPGQ